jgi:hypothetical protein
MRALPAMLLTTQLAGLCACTTPQSAAQPVKFEEPARVSKPTSESRAELHAAVNAALRSSAVTIADDALTASSELIIERVPARDSAGRPLSGRDFDRPQHFDLLRNDHTCILVHRESGQRFPLKNTKCEAAVKSSN